MSESKVQVMVLLFSVISNWLLLSEKRSSKSELAKPLTLPVWLKREIET